MPEAGRRSNAVPGDIKFIDHNDDGNITPQDRIIVGNPFPSYSYGFNLGFGWKGVDVSTLWQGAKPTCSTTNNGMKEEKPTSNI